MIKIQLAFEHSPVIKIIIRHWSVLGKADLSETKFGCLGGILGRLSLRMAAERGVHVIIRRLSHGEKLGKNQRLAKR